MNLQEFKKYAVDNVNSALIEISLKNASDKAAGKIDYFNLSMERNMKQTKERILKMTETLTVDVYNAKKTNLILALATDKIKSQCHKEVYNKTKG